MHLCNRGTRTENKKVMQVKERTKQLLVAKNNDVLMEKCLNVTTYMFVLGISLILE